MQLPLNRRQDTEKMNSFLEYFKHKSSLAQASSHNRERENHPKNEKHRG
jgi:hypothetical protein